ncbi:hypothetical protein BGW39_011826 [Mortierella sp. 14UC]|nr:hypothetical protein BGW39_011826 [Mortierella sp. 14UC]
MSEPAAPEPCGPRTLRSYIRESFKTLNTLEERQKALIDAYLSTPDPTQKVTSASAPAPGPILQASPTNPNSSESSTCGVPMRHQFRGRRRHQRFPYPQPAPLQGADIERQNLLYIRLEYYYSMVALKDLIIQVPDSQLDIRKRYFRHLFVRLDRVLDQMHSEQGGAGSVGGVGGVEGGAQYRQIMIKHRELMTRFANLFKELAPKY